MNTEPAVTVPDEHTSRPPGNLAFAAIFLAFAVWLTAHLGTEARWFSRIPWFQQPALWPTIGLAGMVGFGVINLISCLRARRNSSEWAEVLQWVLGLEYIGWYLAYAWAVPLIGYLPATILVMVLLVWRLGVATKPTLMWAVLFSIGVVVLFKSILSVSIPGGQIYHLLPSGLRLFFSVNF